MCSAFLFFQLCTLSTNFWLVLVPLAGSVRAESFSRPRMFGGGGAGGGIINDAQESRLESFGTECTPDPTMGEVLQEGNGMLDGGGMLSEEEEEELLEKLANRHYYR